jgi:2-dehydropantoate 2-reductase
MVVVPAKAGTHILQERKLGPRRRGGDETVRARAICFAKIALPLYHRAMTKRIAIMGAGALGGYVGGSLARLGHDVTFIDPWPEHVETLRSRGLELDGMTPEERFTVKNVTILHVTEAQALARTPVDIAMVSMKSYDTLWATALVAQYLSPHGYVVSLQNCLNEETIAGVVGWGRVIGVVASLISVDLYEAGRIRRTVPKGGDKHTVFRAGEPHGRITPRVEELVGWLRGIDSAKATTNLWGERWSKLVQNAMGNPITAATGMTTPACQAHPVIRRFALAVAAEGIRVGQALGYQLEKIRGLEPEVLARAGERDAEALNKAEAVLIPRAEPNPRGDIQRPSMAQDILKGRRTEIGQMNGFIARKGGELGIATPANAKITDLVLRIERGELEPSPSLLGA